MNKVINQETGIESSIPLLQVAGYKIDWEINEHATLLLVGDTDQGEMGYLSKLYMGTEIEIYLVDEFQKKEQTIFKGVVTSIHFKYGYGSCNIEIEGASASVELDINKESRSFQNITTTYAKIVKKTIEDVGGSVISTAGNSRIENPVIQYKETAWEFVRRMASLSHTYLIPDIITGRLNIWFGMRRGTKILQLDGWDCGEVTKYYSKDGKNTNRTSYRIASRKFYRIGDYSEVEGQACVIYKMLAEYHRGELLFTYHLAKESELETKPYFNEDFTGMSLLGTVSKTEAQNIYLSLEIDGEEGTYPYPWKPETGNVFYAMPEVGSPAAINFMESDESVVVGVGCVHEAGSQKNRNSSSEFKIMETISGEKVHLFPYTLEITKNERHSVNLNDKDGITVSSEKKIKMEAEGKILLKAKKIRIVVPEEIKAVVD